MQARGWTEVDLGALGAQGTLGGLVGRVIFAATGHGAPLSCILISLACCIDSVLWLLLSAAPSNNFFRSSRIRSPAFISPSSIYDSRSIEDFMVLECRTLQARGNITAFIAPKSNLLVREIQAAKANY